MYYGKWLFMPCYSKLTECQLILLGKNIKERLESVSQKMGHQLLKDGHDLMKHFNGWS